MKKENTPKKLKKQIEEPIVEEPIINEEIDIDDFLNEPIEEPAKKELTFDEEAKLFIETLIMERRNRISGNDIQKLEYYYNTKLGLAERIGNCDLCAIRMFKRLKNIYGIK